MPDDQTAHARARGAEPVTIRMREPGASTLQRHAAHRLPADHPEANRLDQLHAGGHLDARRYANACAVLALYNAAGLGRSKGVADYIRTEIGCNTSDAYGPEDELRRLIETGGVGMQAVLMLVRGDKMDEWKFWVALAYLDTLDMVAARWDGETWRAE